MKTKIALVSIFVVLSGCASAPPSEVKLNPTQVFSLSDKEQSLEFTIRAAEASVSDYVVCSVGLTVENKGNKDFTSGYIDIMLIYDQDETHNKVLWMRDTPLMSGSKPRGFEIWTFNNRCPNFKKAMIRRIL